MSTFVELFQNAMNRRKVAHSSDISGLYVENDLIYSVSYDSTLRIWDNKKKEVKRIIEHNSPISALTVYENRIFTATVDKIVHIWDKENLHEIETLDFSETLRGPPNITKIIINHKNEFFFSGRKLIIRDRESKKIIFTKEYIGFSTDISSDDSFLYIVCNDFLEIIDINTFEEKITKNYSRKGLRSVLVDENYVYLLTGGYLKILEKESLKSICDIVPISGSVRGMSHDSNNIYLYANPVQVIEKHSFKNITFLTAPQRGVGATNSIAVRNITTDLENIYIGLEKGRIYIYRKERNKEISLTTTSKTPISALSNQVTVTLVPEFHRNTAYTRSKARSIMLKHYFYCGDEDGKLFEWDRENWELKGSKRISKKGISNIAFESFESDYLYVGSINGNITVFTFEYQSKPKVLKNDSGVKYILPTLNYLLAGFEDGTVKIWDNSLDCPFISLKCHSSAIKLLHFENNILISYSENNKIKIWNFKELIQSNSKEESSFIELETTPDTIDYFTINIDYIVGASNSKIYYWNKDTGKLVHNFQFISQFPVNTDGIFVYNLEENKEINIKSYDWKIDEIYVERKKKTIDYENLGFDTINEYYDAISRGFYTMEKLEEANSLKLKHKDDLVIFHAEKRRINRLRKLGFISEEEQKEASKLGFSTKSEWDEAKELQFKNKKEWDKALSQGLQSKQETDDYKSSGFEDVNEWRNALEFGFQTKKELILAKSLKAENKKILNSIIKNKIASYMERLRNYQIEIYKITKQNPAYRLNRNKMKHYKETINEISRNLVEIYQETEKVKIIKSIEIEILIEELIQLRKELIVMRKSEISGGSINQLLRGIDHEEVLIQKCYRVIDIINQYIVDLPVKIWDIGATLKMNISEIEGLIGYILPIFPELGVYDASTNNFTRKYANTILIKDLEEKLFEEEEVQVHQTLVYSCIFCGHEFENIKEEPLKCKNCDKKAEKCPICLQNLFKENEIVREKNCGALFHRNHILAWLSVTDQCPMCKERINEKSLENI